MKKLTDEMGGCVDSAGTAVVVSGTGRIGVLTVVHIRD